MKKILFAFCFFAGLTAMAQTPVTTRRVNTDSIVERKLEFGIDMIGALRMHDSVWMLTVPALSSPDAILSIDTVTGAVTRTLIDDILPADTTYPDSSVMITDNNGQPSTDSNDLAWDGNTLYVLNKSNATTSIGAIIITGSGSSQSANGIVHTQVNNVGVNGPAYSFKRARGTLSAPTVPTLSSELGVIDYGGYDGTQWIGLAGSIKARAAGTWGTSSTPVYWEVNTRDANGSLHTSTFTKTGSLSILGGSSDTTYSLTVNGTAAITSTPEISTGTTDASLLIKDNSTNQVISTSYEQGLYLPVMTDSSNIDSATIDTAFYTRVGNIVTVSGRMRMDPTAAATTTIIVLSIPVSVPGTFPPASTYWASGTFASTSDNPETGGIIAEPGTDTVSLNWDSIGNTEQYLSYSFSYRTQ